MKAVTVHHPHLRSVAYAVLQRFPKTRLAARHVYWGLQERRYNQLAKNIPVDEKLVFFESFQGRWCADSPKAIYKAMLKDERFATHVFIWSFRNAAEVDRTEFDQVRTVFVETGTDEYYQALASAKTIVMNMRLPEYVYPKPQQTYVQCWHGTPIKRLANDIEHESVGALNTSKELAWRYSLDTKKWTYLLSASPFYSEHIPSAFACPEEVKQKVLLEVGDPGNDALVQARGNVETKQAMREKLGISPNKKVLLYAPTWRDDSFDAAKGYVLDYLVDFETLQQGLSDEWVVLFRPHYFIANQFNFAAYGGFVIDASKVGDINDCHIASDILVTDYSSVMFDYANLKQPILLHTPDLEHYESDIRGFYFDIKEIPGPLCKTTAELVRAVEELDTYETRYGKAYKAFVDQFCPWDDGRASQRVLEVLA